MVHVELQIISAILQNRDLRSAQQADLAPRHFGEPRARAAYEFLIRYAAENNGDVPDVDIFIRRSGFPDYVELTDLMQVGSLAKEIVKLSAARELEQVLPSHAVIVQDPLAAIDKTLADLAAVRKAHAAAEAIPIWEAEAMLAAREALNAAGQRGIPYPWPSLNEFSRGLRPKQLMVAYGRPGSYKTWLLVALAADTMLNRQDAKILFCSSEMPVEDVVERMATIIARVPYRRVVRGKLDDEEKERYAMARELLRTRMAPGIGTLSILPNTIQHLSGVVTSAETFGPTLLLVDSAYKLRTQPDLDPRSFRSLNQAVESLQGLARNLDIPVVAVLQAGRKKSELLGPGGGDDVYGGDAPAQEADVLLKLHRIEDDTGTPRALIQVAKAREIDLGGLIIEPPPSGSYKEVSVLYTTGAVEYVLTKSHNRSKRIGRLTADTLENYAASDPTTSS
jgi:replicative DNA helicase